MKHKRLCFMAAAALTAGAQAYPAIFINEVMQSNVFTIMDDIKEFPDSWVELYNDGDTGVPLDGYRIGLSSNPDAAYVLHTKKAVIPKGYQLVYCDKADDGELHTDFRLDSGKCTVYLFDPDGNKIDEVSMKKQPAPDIAYARKGDGAKDWGHAVDATPGKSNDGAAFSEKLLGDVIFSEEGGVWKDFQPKEIFLFFPDDAPEEADIIYTTDGSEPVKGKSKVWSDYPIRLTNSGVIRAKLVCDGYLSAPSKAQSYIKLGRDQQIPVVSISGNREYFYDSKIGIFADGTGGKDHENYRYDWRRPVNIEYFPVGEAAAINQLGETRVQGGWTRQNPLKSMAVYANKRFGTKRFDYEFWHKDKPGITDNKSFILRNGGNDYIWCYVRDGLMQRVLGRNCKDVDWQGYSPVIVFLNGQYHAMLALRERSNEDNIYSNYGGLEDLVMVENWEELKAGDMETYNELKDFITAGGHTLEEWDSVINIDSFCALMALNYWVYNTDFPHNNIVVWRPLKGDDQRWRFLVKDCDFGLGIWNSNDNLNKNFHDFLMAGEGLGYDLYRNLMACEDFKKYFEDHMVAYYGDFINGDTFKQYLNEIMEENCGEQLISHDIWKYKDWSWWSNLYDNINFMRTWIEKRQQTMPNLMRRTFGLKAPVNVYVNTDLDKEKSSALHLDYCGTRLTHGVFNGKDFIDRTITLEGAPGDNIVAWDVKTGNGQTVRHQGSCLTLTVSESADLRITAVIDESGIADISCDSDTSFTLADGVIHPEGHITVYDASGRTIASGTSDVTLPSRGIYIVIPAHGTPTRLAF